VSWFARNPSMFHKLADSTGRILGYACIVPLTEAGYAKVRGGRASSLQELEESDVLPTGSAARFWHLEVIAAITDIRSSAGRRLVWETGQLISGRRGIVTAAPITEIGRKLCNYFGFSVVAHETTARSDYAIHELVIDSVNLDRALGGFR
jgi:hypothetical protein